MEEKNQTAHNRTWKNMPVQFFDISSGKKLIPDSALAPLTLLSACRNHQALTIIGTIQKFLGHENRLSTESYLHPIGNSDRDAIAILTDSLKKTHANPHTN